MVTYENILDCEAFVQCETMTALKGLAETNKCPLSEVVDAFSKRNKSVVDVIERHVVESAKALAEQLYG